MDEIISKKWFVSGVVLNPTAIMGNTEMQTFNALISVHPIVWAAKQPNRTIISFFAEIDEETAKEYSDIIKNRKNIIPISSIPKNKGII